MSFGRSPLIVVVPVTVRSSSNPLGLTSPWDVELLKSKWPVTVIVPPLSIVPPSSVRLLKVMPLGAPIT
jgi:hypothetical protein